jgi:predicted TIM-barrel fold metal-dependent hydrolase
MLPVPGEQTVVALQPCQPPDLHTRAASFKPPPFACDTHAHIVGNTADYPLVQDRSYSPALASALQYKSMLQVIGIQRAVIVQPSFYGFDNRCTRDAVCQSGGAWRGVAVLPPTADRALLAGMTSDGFRGARINLLFAGGSSLEALENTARRVADFDWHVQILMDIRQLPGVESRIAALPCHVVFDHLGHFPPAEGLESPGFRSLRRLLDTGRVWVKLSGGYRVSNFPPPFEDLLPFAQCLCEQRPDRLVWGSDWPHTAIEAKMPNDGALLDTLASWIRDEQTRNRILVDNPATLYRFDPS